MQLCGFHCTLRYSFCILVINSMYFYQFIKAIPCVPQGVPVANKYQMWSDVMIIGFSINILYNRYQELLGYQTFTAFLHKSHIFVYFGNFPVGWSWLVSFPANAALFLLFLMPVIQLIYSSSVEAHLLWKCCFCSHNQLLQMFSLL